MRISIVFGLVLALCPVVRAGEVAPLTHWSAPPRWQPEADRVLPDVATSDAGRDAVPPAPNAVPTAPLEFVGVTPCRVADTRDAGFPPGYGPPSMPAGVPRNYTVVGRCGIPATAETLSFNFTVTNTLGSGFLLAYPAGGSQPTVSTLNYLPAQTVANAAVVPLGDGGAITVVPGVSGFDLVVDVNGYYAPVAATYSLVVEKNTGTLPNGSWSTALGSWNAPIEEVGGAGAFNTTTGIWTCPRTASYLFILRLAVQPVSGLFVNAGLVVNGVPVAHTQNPSSENRGAIAVFSRRMTAGQQVYARGLAENASGTLATAPPFSSLNIVQLSSN